MKRGCQTRPCRSARTKKTLKGAVGVGMLLACLEISPYICQKIPDMKSTQSFIFTLGLLLALLPTALRAQQTDEGRDDLYVPTSPSLGAR